MSQSVDVRSSKAAPQASPAQAAVDSALSRQGMGTAIGGAQVHDDPTAHAAASALGANAFTAGADVFFGAGKLAPGTSAGDKLMAHELTHVEQNRGLAAPQPGNFRVSSPEDGAEKAAVAGEQGAAGAAHTIFRDRDPAAPAPAQGGAGPAAATTPAADPYATWKAALARYDRPQAVALWAALPTADKAKVATEPVSFLRDCIYVMRSASAEVLQTANAKIEDFIYAIFLSSEFPAFQATLRAAGLLMPFIAASPRRQLISSTEAAALKAWVDGAPNVPEARAVFQKVYPNISDTATPPLAFGAAPVAWNLAQIRRLYAVLQSSVPVGHTLTITGGFVLQGSQGFGWWEPANRRVALPVHAGTSSAAGDLTGHDMTGGSNAGASGAYTRADGAAGARTTLGHYEGTVLHEVGHGVGARMGGDAYALDPGNYPGWTPMTAATWGAALWEAGTGTGDASVPKEARLDDEHARKMCLHEIANGAGTYRLDAGWMSTDPRNADMRKWVQTKYANVPLVKWWLHLAVQAQDKGNSYAWNQPDARVRGDWAYGYLTRATTPYMKMKQAAYANKVSWYSVSSPLEWFAEQYTHYYRTEKTGGGLIDPNTKALLDRLDTQQFVPVDALPGGGMTMRAMPGSQGGGDGSGGGGGGGGSAGAAARSASGGGPAQGATAQIEPLFFPW